MHFVQLFSLNVLADWDTSSLDLGYDEDEVVETFGLSQKEHLEKFNSEELLEFAGVTFFLMEIGAWNCKMERDCSDPGS